MEVLVFKTNIHLKKDVKKVKPVLEKCEDILGWHVDIMDVDKVLRIEAITDISSEVARLVSAAGYKCPELE